MASNMTPDHDDYVIIIVVPVLGCALFAMAVFALCFYMKKRNSKKRNVQETDIKHVDEHLRVEEVIYTDRHRRKKTEVLSVKDDVHVDENIIRQEKELCGAGGEGDLEVGESSSGASNVAKLDKS